MLRLDVLFLVLLTALSLCKTPVQAQKKVMLGGASKSITQKKSREISGTKRRNKANRSSRKSKKILSAGVVNGKAIDLVKPEFPAAARSIGSYGQIVVQVLIDEQGNVQEATAIAGHPLMRAVSVKAARSSKFEPFILGGQPIQVRGIIVYNYLPESFNWLEIGYILQTRESNNFSSFYTFENLIECLPFGFEDEKQLLETAINDWENSEQAIRTVIAMIEGKLSDTPKDFWLFSLGKILNDAQLNIKYDHDARLKASQSLRLKIQTAPENISKTLITELERLIFLLENSEQDKYNPTEGSKSYQIFSGILLRMSYFGR